MTNKVSNINFYREIYDEELKRKNEIDSSISFPTTLLTLLIGGSIYIFNISNLDCFKEFDIYSRIAIIIFTCIFILSMVITIILLMRIFVNIFKKYKYLPSPFDLNKRENELYELYIKYYKEIKDKDYEKKAVKSSRHQFNVDLLNYYIDFATNNQRLNDIRLKNLYTSRKYLIFSLISIAIIGILLIINN